MNNWQVEDFETHWEDIKKLIHPMMKEDHLHELLKVPNSVWKRLRPSKICTWNPLPYP
jgi:hypothetical protein